MALKGSRYLERACADFGQSNSLKGPHVLPRAIRTMVVSIVAVSMLVDTASGQYTFSLLKSFGFIDRSGKNPQTGLIEGSDGAIYGTTYSGGTSNLGTIF